MLPTLTFGILKGLGPLLIWNTIRSHTIEAVFESVIESDCGSPAYPLEKNRMNTLVVNRTFNISLGHAYS